jgi:murein L,D-transpeptidase YafK
MIKSFVVAILSFFILSPAWAQEKDEEKELVWLSVDKENLRATLYTLPIFPENPVPLQSFRIAIGKEKGDKLRQGDNKTPEGIYFTVAHVPEHSLIVQKYGRLALALDFPNLMDSLEEKTGYGIWLHGAGDDNRIAAENVTEGCVAFYNDDIVKLKHWLVPKQGLVLISHDAKHVNDLQERKEVHNLTQSWFQSWRERDLKKYIEFYSDRFEYEEKNKRAYEKYKSRVFRSYKNMTLTQSTLRVLSHPKYTVSVMNQSFNGDDRYISTGRKVLYWQKEAQGWKIVRETFLDISMQKLDLSDSKRHSLGKLTKVQ